MPGRPAAGQPAGEDAESLPFRFGRFTAGITDLADPAAVDIASDGRIVIVERAAHRVTICDRQGKRLRSFGGFGRGPGQFAFPEGVAIFGRGPDAQILVADTGNHRVQFFTMDGTFIRGWGSRGTAPGQFNRPTGLTVDEDRVYVADTGNDRVQMLNHDGTVLLALDSAGGAQSAFSRPSDVAVDDQRLIYVADTDNNRIAVFDEDGEFIRSWGDWGPFIGLMNQPSAVTVRDQRVYVTETLNHRVQVFTLDGVDVYQWGLHARYPRQADGRLHYPNDMAIAPDGSFAVVCEAFEDRCQLFDVAPDDVTEEQAGSPYQPQPAQTHFGNWLSVADNLLAVGEPESHTMYVFRIDREVPVMVTKHAGRGTGAHQFINLGGIDLHTDPLRVYVADPTLNRVQKFGMQYDRHETLRYRPFITRLHRVFDLDYVSRRLVDDGVLRWAIDPVAVRRTDDGTLWVSDARNGTVHKLAVRTDAMDLASLGDVGGGRSRLLRPSDLAVDVPRERVYVVDRGARDVKVYGINGSLLFTFDGSDSEGGALEEPFGIAAGTDAFIYVTDMAGNRVVKFDQDGAAVQQWGERGIDDGQFWKPGDIAQATDGRLFVADYGNHRVQIFSAEGEWLVSFGLSRSSTRETREAAQEEAEMAK